MWETKSIRADELAAGDEVVMHGTYATVHDVNLSRDGRSVHTLIGGDLETWRTSDLVTVLA